MPTDVLLGFSQASAEPAFITWFDMDHPGWTDGETIAVRLVQGVAPVSTNTPTNSPTPLDPHADTDQHPDAPDFIRRRRR